jgi:hypothetical protein
MYQASLRFSLQALPHCLFEDKKYLSGEAGKKKGFDVTATCKPFPLFPFPLP